MGQSGVLWCELENIGGGVMFLGTYEPKLDEKFRLILPAKYREQLENGLVITKGQEHCLYVFPVSEFESMYSELKKAPLTSKQARDYIRVILSGANNEIPDKQGRITIPQQLRSYANLHREVTVIGAGSRVEIWDRQTWNEYIEKQESGFADTEEEIIPGIF